MRYVQLRAFHFVAVEGSFSQAAEMLNLTQPAISDQVRKLEEDYDLLLFDRRKKKIALTAFGGRLLEFTQRLFDIEQQTRDFLLESRALRSGRLRIVADSPHHLLKVMAAFQSKFPGVFVSVRSGNSDEVVEALQTYHADIGVLGEVPPGREFDIVQLSSAPIVAFTSVNYARRTKAKMSFADLLKHPLVMREQGSKTRQMLVNFAREGGHKLVGAIEAEGREAVREIVASGAGIGFVSGAEFGFDRRLVKIDISDFHQTMDEALICLKSRKEGKLIRAFMELADDKGH